PRQPRHHLARRQQQRPPQRPRAGHQPEDRPGLGTALQALQRRQRDRGDPPRLGPGPAGDPGHGGAHQRRGPRRVLGLRPVLLPADAENFSPSEVLARLSPGQSASLYVSVRDGVRADRISQSLEFLVEQKEVPSGWVLTFERNGESVIQGNVLKAGRYTTRL